MTIAPTDQPVLVTTGNGRVDAVDAVAAVAAATSPLSALGLKSRSEHTRRTAERMVAAYRDLLTPRPFEATTFANEEGHHDLVISRSVPFASLCAHHVLPFVGTATVGYRPGSRLLGLSKLARVVDLFARRLQVQEDMTQQIAGWFDETLPDHRGVGVLVTAEHLCMTVRGAEAHDASTLTTAWRGDLARDPQLRTESRSPAKQRARKSNGDGPAHEPPRDHPGGELDLAEVGNFRKRHHRRQEE